MALDGEMRHLTSETIQEFLDRQLTPQEEASVREHLAVCPRCQSELEAWSLLFADLSDLPELDPTRDFAGPILEQTPVRTPLVERARSWWERRKARAREEAHIPSGSIQDYVEGLLPVQPRARVEAHLASCSSCRREVQEWHGLLEGLQPLAHFAPGPGFAEKVMAEVSVPAPAPVPSRGWASLPGRALAWARGLVPKTRHGWAVVGGVASAPTITIGALVYLVFSRPLVTPGTFGSYVLWKVTELVNTLASVVSTDVRESGILIRAGAFMEPFTGSPVLLGLGGVVLSLISAGALWILYRNLVAPPSGDRYARVRAQS